jgi:hypothetical protein
MPLLFWYFPLIVFSGAYEAYFSDAENSIDGRCRAYEKHAKPVSREWAGICGVGPMKT